MRLSLAVLGIPLRYALLVYFLMLGQTYFTIVTYNQGHFGYALDDPYIHLALAKNLAHGHYGLNPNEVCTPSSSLLWPFLLVPGFWLGGGIWLPFVWNVLAGGGAIVLAASVIETALRTVPEPRRRTAQTILLLGFIFAVNLTGLVFTGMEHTLHVALSLAAFRGLVQERDENKAPLWLGIVLGLLPLIRYEGLAMTLGAVLYLLIRRRFSVALTALVLALVPLAGFTAFSLANHQGFLPNSITAKAQVQGEPGILELIRLNLLRNIRRFESMELIVLTTLVFREASHGRWRWLCLWAGGACVLHLCFGSLGWFSRYEPYILAVLLGTLTLCYGKVLGRLAPATLAGITLALSALYLPPTLETADASNEIYNQQYQMQRLVTLWDGPVAVNDIGWVSLTARHYVLDLFGLANREALVRSKKEPMSAWVDDLARRHDVRLALVYESWYPQRALPPAWIRVGSLVMNRATVMVLEAQVVLYATDVESAERLRSLLPDFAKTLPPLDYIKLTDGTLLFPEAAASP